VAYLADEKVKFYLINSKGNGYGVCLNEMIEGLQVERSRNQMKKQNYFPFRSYFSNSNGIFFSMQDVQMQLEQ